MLFLLAPLALAWESDTLTLRPEPLPDVTEELDLRVQMAVDLAIERTNEITGCDDPDPDTVHRTLAREIHRRTAPNQTIKSRKGLRALGYDRYSAWIEDGNVPLRSFQERDDIFAAVRTLESFILKFAGVCSTVRVNDVLVGTDKLDHFFEEGYDAWLKSKRGRFPERAIDWATKTENGGYGLMTSGTFSWGDLRADWDGHQFYDGLLDGEHALAEVAEDGCLVATRPFTWRDWVTWEYDEVMNPSVHTAPALKGVRRHLEEHREAYCAEYAQWGGADYERHLASVLSEDAIYASDKAPPRTDPFQLAELCAESAAEASPDAP